MLFRSAEARGLLYVAATTNLLTAVAVVLAALVAVRFALLPLNQLGLRLEQHEVDRLRPLPLRLAPQETLPLLRAINRLMGRVRGAAEARQAFLDGTAHQLRTPLASLSAQVALLEREALSPEAAARVAEVSLATRRLSHLAQQMLSLARAGADGDDAVALQPLALASLFEELASSQLDTALARQVDLGFDAGPAEVLGSAWLLRELLENLVSNALAHAPAGGRVTVRCHSPAGHAVLEVDDDGPGIPVADRERVFARHVRLHPGQGHGAGLGLAIVREIAHRHGAQVRIEDGPDGRGTRVRVDFPPLHRLSGN